MITQCAVSYFAGAEPHRRHLREAASEGYNPFAVPNVYSRPAKILYIVSFKCKRADIFYIPENTGLQVKAGDTVIVEGDRGQDLGTVEHVNVTMEQAKKLKEDHTRQHFRCLMMFSRLYPHMAALAGNEELFDETLASQINATGSSAHPGPTSGHSRDIGLPFESEPRPKMIKRVAKPDEVHLLREKEGNEAKAKRVCQNKVSEHSLRMEILDAEFQQ
jgi:cell fate regulator YaaT (PSP1 superfamily)